MCLAEQLARQRAVIAVVFLLHSGPAVLSSQPHQQRKNTAPYTLPSIDCHSLPYLGSSLPRRDRSSDRIGCVSFWCCGRGALAGQQGFRTNNRLQRTRTTTHCHCTAQRATGDHAAKVLPCTWPSALPQPAHRPLPPPLEPPAISLHLLGNESAEPTVAPGDQHLLAQICRFCRSTDHPR